MKPFKPTHLLLVLLISCGHFALAQPSGGPYGPVSTDYAIPEEAHSVYYVSANGDAKASGRTEDVPTTIAVAISQAVTGDAIILRGGVYRTGSLSFNQGITLQPYGNETVIFKGTKVAHDWERLPSGLWRTKWETLFPSKPQDWWRGHVHGHQTPLYWFNNDMVFFDGKLLHPVGWEGEVDKDAYYINYDAGWVYIGRNPKGHLLEITAHDNALTRSIGEVRGKVSDGIGPVIRGITFTQYAYRAIEISGTEPEGLSDPGTYGNDVTGTVLENVTISYCSRVAGYFRGNGLVIRNCLISDTETEGLFILSSNDVLLERNIIRRNNMQNMQGYYPAAVKIFNQCHRVICRDNLVYDNPNSNGIWYDVGNVDGLFIGNWIEDSTDGFFFEISKGAIVAGNVFIDCEKGVRSLNSSNVEVYHNTFINSMASFERTDRGGPDDHFGWHPSTGPAVDEREGHVFRNNLLIADENYHRVLFNTQQRAVLCDTLTESQMRELDYNVYVRKGARVGEPSYSWSPAEAKDCRALLRCMDDFRALGTGFSENSLEFMDYEGQVLQSIQLRNLQLLPNFPGANHTGPIERHVLDAIGWKAGDQCRPGAFPGK
jgi:hypothetical protein